jgi:hypothetical protein
MLEVSRLHRADSLIDRLAVRALKSQRFLAPGRTRNIEVMLASFRGYSSLRDLERMLGADRQSLYPTYSVLLHLPFKSRKTQTLKSMGFIY